MNNKDKNPIIPMNSKWIIDTDSSLIRRLPELKRPREIEYFGSAEEINDWNEAWKKYRTAFLSQPTAIRQDNGEFEAILKEKQYLEEGVDFELQYEVLGQLDEWIISKSLYSNFRPEYRRISAIPKVTTIKEEYREGTVR